MAKKKKSASSVKRKARKRRMIVLVPVSLICILYFIFLTINYMSNIYSLNKNENELKNQLLELKEEEITLKNEIQKLQDPDYIARFARENYLYSKNGEYVIKINDDKEVKNDNRDNNNEKIMNYAIIGSGVFIVIVFIYMLKKK